MRPQCGETHAGARWQPLTCEVVRGGSQLGGVGIQTSQEMWWNQTRAHKAISGMRAAAEKVICA